MNLRTLEPGQWIKDEVINYFLSLLALRDQRLVRGDSSPGRRSHFFKSFFFTQLLNEGHKTLAGVYSYANVKRWSKKVPGTSCMCVLCVVCDILSIACGM